MFRQIAITPGLLSISFGIFLLLLSGAAGFYVPKEVAQKANASSSGAVAPSTAVPSPTSGTSPSPVATARPAAVPSPTVAPTPTATPTATPAARVHVVKAGDTLLEIADKYGVSSDAVMKANGMSNPDKLAEGDKLIIPSRQLD